jgi:menaquinone-9 beta-reductase
MPEIINTEIAIIGAGPAGLTAAIRLGQKGIPCVIAEKDRFPREKICGDGLSGKVISTLKRIDPDFITELTASGFTTPSYAARFFSPRRNMLELSFKAEDPSHPPGFVCQRVDFDNFLMSKAVKYSGNQFLEGTRISKIVRAGGRVVLEDEGRTITVNAGLVLIAAGSNRRLIQQLDPDYPGMVEEGVGVRGYFENVTGADRLHAIEIHFFKELLPWYFWIFPYSDGSANVGLALPESQAKKLKTSLKELLFHLIKTYPHLQKRFANATLRGKIEAHRLPVHTAGGSICAGDNYLLLGDAARLVDPFTGEGIGNAMVSGSKAADIAEKCYLDKNYSYSATEEYQKNIAEKLYPELDLSLKLQNLARKQRLLNLVIGKASRDENIRNLMSDMLYSTYAKSKLNNPWFYLKLLLGL